MKHIRTCLCALFISASFCPASIAMEEQPNGNPLNLALSTLTLNEAPAARTLEEQKELNANLYTACKGADPIEAGQPRVVDISRVTELLGQGADINTRGIGGNTPLQVTCYLGFEDVVDILLACENIKIDAQNDKHFSALYMASGGGFEGIVQKLLAKGAEKELDDINGLTALHAATLHNRLRVVELLIGAGALVDAPNDNEVRPIHSAFLYAYADIALLLMDHGADLHTPDKSGITPGNSLFYSKTSDLALEIINKKEVAISTRRAFEPFFVNAMFCVNKDIRILQALLAHGMNINILLKNNWTPLHYACGMNCMDIAEFLIRSGADLMIEDANGRTPLDCISKQELTVRLLTVAGESLVGGGASSDAV